MNEDEQPCPELIPRRYWVDVGDWNDLPTLSFRERFYRAQKRYDLQEAGFRKQSTGNFVYKTTRLDKVLRMVTIAKSILGPNNGYSEEIRVSTQPLCRSCGALLRFSDTRCGDCGSFNIEHPGRLNIDTCKIEFEKFERRGRRKR